MFMSTYVIRRHETIAMANVGLRRLDAAIGILVDSSHRVFECLH